MSLPTGHMVYFKQAAQLDLLLSRRSRSHQTPDSIVVASKLAISQHWSTDSALKQDEAACWGILTMQVGIRYREKLGVDGESW